MPDNLRSPPVGLPKALLLPHRLLLAARIEGTHPSRIRIAAEPRSFRVYWAMFNRFRKWEGGDHTSVSYFDVSLLPYHRLGSLTNFPLHPHVREALLSFSSRRLFSVGMGQEQITRETGVREQTSYWSQMAEIPLRTDLSGPKTSADSLAILRRILAPEPTTDIKST